MRRSGGPVTRIGYARSTDGLTWVPESESVGIAASLEVGTGDDQCPGGVRCRRPSRHMRAAERCGHSMGLAVLDA